MRTLVDNFKKLEKGVQQYRNNAVSGSGPGLGLGPGPRRIRNTPREINLSENYDSDDSTNDFGKPLISKLELQDFFSFKITYFCYE